MQILFGAHTIKEISKLLKKYKKSYTVNYFFKATTIYLQSFKTAQTSEIEI